jgi:hypothetical protein
MCDSDLPPPAERRPQARRRSLFAGIVIHSAGQFSFNCTIRDISADGARIVFAAGSFLPSNCYLVNKSAATAHSCEVAWATKSTAGLKFLASFSMAAVPEELGFLKRFR